MNRALSEQVLAAFVPQLVLRRLPGPPGAARGEVSAEAAQGVVFFADIAGFTPLTEKLTRRGPIGAELLRETLNAYFGELIGLVTDHGGDVLTFAGDAMIALWPAADGAPLEACARAAAHCALAAQQRLAGFRTEDGSPLQLRIGLAAGPLQLLDVGGQGDQRHFLAAGAPLAEVGGAKRQAAKGEVVAAPSMCALLGEALAGDPLADGQRRVRSVAGEFAPRPRASLALAPEALPPLRRYVPAAVLDRLDAGQSEWLAEFRAVSVMFVSLPDLRFTAGADAAALHAATRAIQAELARLEGNLVQLLMDDVSTVFVLVFGLPPLVHEEDPVRAASAALRIRTALGERGLRSAIGIATGSAFCGAFGSPQRHEYALVGDVMNLAARLMNAAGDAILCDGATRAAAEGGVQFGDSLTLSLKGKSAPVECFRALRERAEERTRRPARATPDAAALVGRQTERAAVRGSLSRLLAGTGGAVVIEGEAGIGKSRLLEDLAAEAHPAGIALFAGGGDALAQGSTYHAWRPIVARILAAGESAGATSLGSRALERLQALPGDADWARWAPLLNAVVPLDLPENEVTAAMSGQARAETTRELVALLLRGAASRQPTAIVLDDAHWLDSASWALAAAVQRRVPQLLLVVATRPLGDAAPAEFAQIADAPDTRRIALQRLDRESVAALLAQRLGVASLPSPVSALIDAKAEGNPLFSEELAYALRDAGLIVIEDGRCRLPGGADSLAAVTLPATVQGVITSRIDRLAPPERLTVRVASVIGRVIPFRVLRDLYPVSATEEELKRHLETLATLDLMPLETPEPGLKYAFKHIITQEVAYQTLSFAQRRQLHGAAAAWYERSNADDPPYPLLAHHWKAAGAAPKAIDCFERAGDAAVRQFGNAEAVRFFTEARTLDAEARERVPTLRRAHWEHMLGKAHRELGNMTESRTYLLNALALLGEPAPGSALRLAAATLRETAKQTLRRLRSGADAPSRPGAGAGTGEDGRRRLELVDAAIEFSYLCYFSNDMPPILWATALALNAAEESGASSELAAMYASAGGVCGFLPLHGMARKYFRLGAEVAGAIGQPLAGAQVDHYLGHYLGGVGDWPGFRAALERAMQTYDRYGNRRRWDECLTNAAFEPLFTGDFERALQAFERLEASALRRDDAQVLSWALIGQARAFARLARGEEALARLAAAEPHVRDRLGALELHGIGCGALLALGRSDAALAAAARAAALIAEKPPPSYTTLLTFDYVAEACARRWRDAAASDGDTGALAARAHQARRALASFARVFPIGEPAALHWRGVLQWLGGNRRGARISLARALTAAERLQMRYEAARARQWMQELEPAAAG